MMTTKYLALFLCSLVLLLSLFPHDVAADAAYWRRWKWWKGAYKYNARTKGSNFLILLCYRHCWTYGYTCQVSCSKNGLFAYAYNGLWSGGYAYENTWRWYASCGDPDYEYMRQLQSKDEEEAEKPEDGDGLSFSVIKSGDVQEQENKEDGSKQLVVTNIQAYMAVGAESNFVSSFSIIAHTPGQDVIDSDEPADLDKTTKLFEATGTFANGKLDLKNLDYNGACVKTNKVPVEDVKVPFEMTKFESDPDADDPDGTCESVPEVPTPKYGADVTVALTCEMELEKLVIDIPKDVDLKQVELTFVTDGYYSAERAGTGTTSTAVDTVTKNTASLRAGTTP